MTDLTWQKSSYCAQGNSCVHVAAHDNTVNVTESSDPTGAILRTTPTAWAALLRSVKAGINHG
ncbi:DUF397 domain-containing protein [Streptomyces sp. NPDC002596]|uniref:DUF397 domain-containing protein n=1 Tax=unclassified Streptomyces TaxID=2593676 RepID=UPI002E154550|nr:DUF397 domain-containing protein [Streptomyces sp. NBC_01320]